MLGVPVRVVADVEVEVAVAVEVGERGGRRPVPVAPEAGPCGRVLERAVAPVVVEGVGVPAGDEEVGAAVVVVVADGDAVAVASGHGLDPRRPGRWRPLNVPSPRRCGTGGRQSRRGRSPGARRERAPPGTQVDVEPAVAVVVEHRDAAGGRLGELAERRPAVLERERRRPSGRGVVDGSSGEGPETARAASIPRPGVGDRRAIGAEPEAARRASHRAGTASRPAGRRRGAPSRGRRAPGEAGTVLGIAGVEMRRRGATSPRAASKRSGPGSRPRAGRGRRTLGRGAATLCARMARCSGSFLARSIGFGLAGRGRRSPSPLGPASQAWRRRRACSEPRGCRRGRASALSCSDQSGALDPARGRRAWARRARRGTTRTSASPRRDRPGRCCARGAAGLGGVARRERPVEPGTPDGGVVGSALEAAVEEAAGVGEGRGQGRQVGLRQPDPVVVGGLDSGLVDRGADRGDLGRRVVDHPEVAEFGRRPRGAVPAVADDPPHGVAAAFLEVQLREGVADLGLFRPLRDPEHRLQHRFSVGVAAEVAGERPRPGEPARRGCRGGEPSTGIRSQGGERAAG